MINIWGTFESNYYQGKQSYSTVAKIAKNFAEAVLITTYKVFVRPHLDHDNMIYDEAYNETFHQQLDSIPYNACLLLSAAIRWSSRGKLSHELGLESLQHRHWCGKLCLFYKIFKEKKHIYLFNPISTKKNGL